MPALLRDPVLCILAEALDDIERTRIANENRLRTLTFPDPAYGHGLSLADPTVAQVAAIVDGLNAIEAQTIKALQRVMREHPIGGLVADTPGLGEKQTARLLARIGDPYWHDAEDRPRSVRELWAYCGLHVMDGEAPKRRKGEKANWNAEAKKRVWLIAQSCIKQARSPYRKVYDDTRAKYADAIHEKPCARCGPSGKPAQIGTDLNDGHKHARAIRAMCKAILLDLWIEASIEHDLEAAKMVAA